MKTKTAIKKAVRAATETVEGTAVVLGAVARVWAFRAANPDMPKADAVAALVEQGINKATANTQLYKWAKATDVERAARAGVSA